MRNEIEPTWFLSFKLWWAWCWRATLIVIIAAVIAGFIVGTIGYLLGVEKEMISNFGGLSGFIVALYVMPHIFKRLMVKGFGRYRLVVVEKD